MSDDDEDSMMSETNLWRGDTHGDPFTGDIIPGLPHPNYGDTSEEAGSSRPYAHSLPK